MATFRRVEDIDAWQLARELTNSIYEVSRKGAFARDITLCDQIRRACISILSNIAEGYERGGNKEFRHFLSMAKGSAGEVKAQLYVALDQQYIDTDAFGHSSEMATRTSRLIGGLMSYLRTSEYRGTKFKQ